MSRWVLVMVAVLVVAANFPFGPPDAADGADKPRSRRLVKPWSEMTSLSDEQKGQIIEIHQQALEDRKAIDRREREQIVALLTEEQQTELRDLEDKKAAERKAKEAEKKARAEEAREKEE